MEKGSLQIMIDQVQAIKESVFQSPIKEIIEEIKWLTFCIEQRVAYEKDYTPDTLQNNIVHLIREDLWKLKGQIQILKRFLDKDNVLGQICDVATLIEYWVARRT